MAQIPVGQRKRLAMGHELRRDARPERTMVVPRPGRATVTNSTDPQEHATKVNESFKPTLTSRAGVEHKAPDKGRRFYKDEKK